jgi:hypothetical protein
LLSVAELESVSLNFLEHLLELFGMLGELLLVAFLLHVGVVVDLGPLKGAEVPEAADVDTNNQQNCSQCSEDDAADHCAVAPRAGVLVGSAVGGSGRVDGVVLGQGGAEQQGREQESDKDVLVHEKYYNSVQNCPAVKTADLVTISKIAS